jgi:hypothetical protein
MSIKPAKQNGGAPDLEKIKSKIDTGINTTNLALKKKRKLKNTLKYTHQRILEMNDIGLKAIEESISLSMLIEKSKEIYFRNERDLKMDSIVKKYRRKMGISTKEDNQRNLNLHKFKRSKYEIMRKLMN